MQGPFSQPAAHHLIALLTPQKWQTSALSRNMPLCESSCVAAASISISAQMTSLHIIWLFPWLAFPSRGHYFIYPPPHQYAWCIFLLIFSIKLCHLGLSSVRSFLGESYPLRIATLPLNWISFHRCLFLPLKFIIWTKEISVVAS